MRLPALTKTPLPPELERWTQALEARLDDSTEGYVRLQTPGAETFLFFHQGKAHSAGLAIGAHLFRSSVPAFFETARSATAAELCTTDLPLFLCTAVLFQKAPSARLPADLMSIDGALVDLAAAREDAVLVVNHGDARTLAFCHQGAPAVLYGPEGEPLRDAGAPAARIVAYVGDATKPSSVDIYQDLQVEACASGGHALSSYVGSSEAKRAEPTLWLVVRMQGGVVFHQPIDRDETRIGRGPGNELVLNNLSVSRRHARIIRTNGELALEDLGGEGGVKLNDQPVKGTVPIGLGSMFEIGAYTITVDSAPVAGAAAAPPPAVVPDLRATTRFRVASFLPAEIIHGGESIPLTEATLDIGRHAGAGIQLRGWLVAPIQVQIVRDGPGHRVRHIAGVRRLRLNGKVVRDAKLSDGDRFEVAGASFQYVAPRPG